MKTAIRLTLLALALGAAACSRGTTTVPSLTEPGYNGAAGGFGADGLGGAGGIGTSGLGGGTLPGSQISDRVHFLVDQSTLTPEAIAILDAQIGWRSAGGGFEGGVFAKNLLDTRYIGSISPIESLGFEILTYGAPRRLGVYARVKY